jgi:hypothetical protein
MAEYKIFGPYFPRNWGRALWRFDTKNRVLETLDVPDPNEPGEVAWRTQPGLDTLADDCRVLDVEMLDPVTFCGISVRPQSNPNSHTDTARYHIDAHVFMLRVTTDQPLPRYFVLTDIYNAGTLKNKSAPYPGATHDVFRENNNSMHWEEVSWPSDIRADTEVSAKCFIVRGPFCLDTRSGVLRQLEYGVPQTDGKRFSWSSPLAESGGVKPGPPGTFDIGRPTFLVRTPYFVPHDHNIATQTRPCLVLWRIDTRCGACAMLMFSQNQQGVDFLRVPAQGYHVNGPKHAETFRLGPWTHLVEVPCAWGSTWDSGRPGGAPDGTLRAGTPFAGYSELSPPGKFRIRMEEAEDAGVYTIIRTPDANDWLNVARLLTNATVSIDTWFTRQPTPAPPIAE